MILPVYGLRIAPFGPAKLQSRS